MAYTIISQNNTTTTLSDENGNVITVPARVTLATSTDYTIKKVNNNSVDLESGDGKIIRGVPACVVLAGGGGGDQHNLGYYATQTALEEAHPTAEAGDWAIVGATDTVWIWDTDNSEWVDSDQKGQVTSVNGQTGDVVIPAGATYTAGTGISIDANNEISVTDPVVTNSATEQTALAVGSISNPATASSGAYWAAAVGANASVTAADGVAVGANTSTTAADGVAIGPGARVTAAHAIQISSWDRGTRVTNSAANTVNIANGVGNYRVLEADGTIPEARLADTTNAQQGDVLTLDSTGNAVWQAGGGGGGSSYTAGTGIDITNDVISTDVPMAIDPVNTDAPIAEAKAYSGTELQEGDGVIAIGPGAQAKTTSSTQYATFTGTVVIGEKALATSNAVQAVAVGNLATVQTASSVAIGFNSLAKGNGGVAIGGGAQVNGSNGGVAIGGHAHAARGAIILSAGNNGTFEAAQGCFDVVLNDTTFATPGQYTLLKYGGLMPADRLASTTGLADGNYRLRLVMASGVPTLEWVAE